MAIDYKKEWGKLRESNGTQMLLDGKGQMLCIVMDNQISRTIGKRESLMREYVKQGLKTDIASGSKMYYYVCISINEHAIDSSGTFCIPKKDLTLGVRKKEVNNIDYILCRLNYAPLVFIL